MHQASSLLFLLQHQLNAQSEASKLFSSAAYMPSFPIPLEEQLKRMSPAYTLNDISSANNLAILAKQAAYSGGAPSNGPQETRFVKSTGFKLKNPNKGNSIPKSSHENAEPKTKEEKALEKETNKQVGLLSPSKKISKHQDTNDENKKYRFRRSWSAEEDEKILALIKELGQNWGAISKRIGGTRTGKQIRDRYLNKLDPKISNAKWTQEEDDKLLRLYLAEGKKWCLISRSLPGRTEISVKNRFYSKYKHLFYRDGGGANSYQLEMSKSKGSDDQLDSVASAGSNQLPETNSSLRKLSFQKNNSNPHSELNFQLLNSLATIETEGSKKQIELSMSGQEKTNSPNRKTQQTNADCVKIEHVEGGNKIVEEKTAPNVKGRGTQGMELENSSLADRAVATFEMADKIAQQISSLEELMNASRSGLGFLMTIKQLLQFNQAGGGKIPLSKSDCCNAIRSVMSNLSTLESSFNNTTQDTSRLLNQLILQIKE